MVMVSGRREWYLGSFFFVLLIVGMLGVLFRCWWLQFYHCNEYRQQAARQQARMIPQTARRGLILDRRGRVLALSTRAYSVGVDPSFIKDIAGTSQFLAEVLGLDTEQLNRKIRSNSGKKFLWLKQCISDQQAQVLRSRRMRGVVVKTTYRRDYPMGHLACHVIGFVNSFGEGKEGIEACYDDVLAGKAGRLLLRSDVKKRPVALCDGSQPSRDGQTVVLTIDAVIQSCVEEQLCNVVEKYHAAGAVGIVMDPSSGEILAMANWPGFDPDSGRPDDDKLIRNRALTDPFEPGSIFKPITVASALAGGYIRRDEKIFCHNGLYSGKGFGRIREYEGHSFADLTAADIVIRSSNIGAAKIAQRMGKEYFFGMIESFGFGRKTGIDLDGEDSGLLMPLKDWKWGQYALTRAAYGQGPVAATPIQLIRAFCCLANGGCLVRPSMVRDLLDSDDGDSVKSYLEQRADWDADIDAGGRAIRGVQVIPADVADYLVAEVLAGVVEREGGTAKKAAVEGYRVFGKTGTANVADKAAKGYDKNKYNSSFIGGAPAENPRLCVLVTVCEPDKSLGLGYTGGVVAAGAVGEILKVSLEYLGIEKKIHE